MGVEVATEDVVGVTLQRFQTLAGTQFPDLQRLVVGGAHQEPRITRPGNITDAQLVAGDGLLELAIVGAPDLDEFVGGRACQPLAVGAELD